MLLLKCPFCGSLNLTVSFGGLSFREEWIHCIDCDAHGPHVSVDHTPQNELRDTVIMKWNNRC